MTNFRKITLICSLIMFTTSAFALGSSFSDAFSIQERVEEQEGLTITITINSSSTIVLKGLSKTASLEVMSVLGKRVSYKEMKDCMNGVYLELPNGIYILKAGKVTQKIVVRN